MLRLNYEKIFKSLSDNTRLRIARLLLNGAFNVNEVQFIIGGKQSNISHHLRTLLDSGLVSNKREGSQIYYQFAESSEEIDEFVKLIEKLSYKIEQADEDNHRMEIIFTERSKIAENYFDNIKKENVDEETSIFESIYTVDNYLSFFGKKCSSILDIGCGNGNNLVKLSKHTSKVIGIDTSPRMLQLSKHLCSEKGIDYELKMADVNKLPFEDRKLDGVFVNMVLHHVANPSGAIKEISRTLKPDGRLLLVDFMKHSHEEMRKKYADLWLGFTDEQMSKWLYYAGLQITDRELVKKEGFEVFVLKVLKT